MKRLFSAFLAALMALSVFALPVSAANNEGRPASDLDEALNVSGGALHFTTDAQYPWVVEGDAAKSGNSGVPDSRSAVYTSVNTNEGDVISFDFCSRGEGNENGLGLVWDGFQFRINGELIAEWGKREGWEHYAITLPSGVHELSFSYKKDGSVDPEGDCAYLDNVYVGAPVLWNTKCCRR